MSRGLTVCLQVPPSSGPLSAKWEGRRARRPRARASGSGSSLCDRQQDRRPVWAAVSYGQSTVTTSLEAPVSGRQDRECEVRSWFLSSSGGGGRAEEAGVKLQGQLEREGEGAGGGRREHLPSRERARALLPPGPGVNTRGEGWCWTTGDAGTGPLCQVA